MSKPIKLAMIGEYLVEKALHQFTRILCVGFGVLGEWWCFSHSVIILLAKRN